MAFAIAPTPKNWINISDIEAQKAAAAVHTTPPDPIYANQGGDTFATATVIPSIPYSDSGTTSGYVDNYNSCIGCFDCPYSVTGGRDVVYRFTPAADVVINVDLCDSGYDTKGYVVDGVISNVVGCSDDECGTTPPVGWKSFIPCVSLIAGHTYYIIVDAYSSADFGAYQLRLTECTPCIVTCPPGSVLEGEPVCHDDYYDTTNGGCNSVPPVFLNLDCSPNGLTTVCGEYGGFFYAGLSYRDTDWYQITLPAAATITWCAEGEYDTLVGVIDGNAGCPVTAFYDYNYGGGCTSLCTTNSLPAGTWWFFVGPLGFGPAVGACGGNYTATLEGFVCPPVAVEPATWGTIKNLYR